MKIFTGIILYGIVICSIVCAVPSTAQTGVLNPNDPIVVYNPAKPPATPAYGTLVKWVKTNRMSWSTTSFKAYFYKNVAFRLKFPKSYQHNVADGKTYPLYIFFHGIGEKGTIYDNEFQLSQGGSEHKTASENGKFDGFMLYMQSSVPSGFFGDYYYDVLKELIENYFVPQVKVDINRICVDGLSGGGSACWEFLSRYPKLAATITPISSNSLTNRNLINTLKYTPIWNFQGELDNNPAPSTSKTVRDAYLSAGANYKYTEFPAIGHGCWYKAWADPDFFPFINRAHKANPWPVTGRTEFCPGVAVNVTLGVTAGFDGYQWTKNGVVIPAATANTLLVTAIGTYACRLKRGAVWSPWSPKPVVIKIKLATVPPSVTVSGLASKVVPSPDGKTGVTIQVSSGFTSYAWQKTDNTTILSTQSTLTNAVPGSYKTKVTELWGCAPVYSNPFTVINANGVNGPKVPLSLIASIPTKTTVKLTWLANASTYAATNFEVYQATSSGGPYKLINITASTAVTYTAVGLNPKTTYYFKLRAVNNNAASPVTGVVYATTLADVTPPAVPGTLRTGTITKSSVELYWNTATDDVGVAYYDVYVNSIKAYTFSSAIKTYKVIGLAAGTRYTFAVKARDISGNSSASTNIVTVTTPTAFIAAQPPTVLVVDQQAVAVVKDTLHLNAVSLNRNQFEISTSRQPQVSAYPNPFVSDVTVKLSLQKAADKLTVLVWDARGNIVFTKDLRNVPQGISQQKLGINNKVTASGIYFLQVSGLHAGDKSNTVKLIK